MDNGKEIGRLLGYGSLTAALYFALFFFERELMQVIGRGGWAFLIPVAFAFAVSVTHGAFTGAFWDFVGIKAKK